MQLYGLKTCDTTRKALKTLRDAGVEVTYIDVRADIIPERELSWFLVAFGDEMLNKRSTTWRGLSDSDRALDAATLIRKHPTVMKRPVIHTDTDFHLGWNAEVQLAVLG